MKQSLKKGSFMAVLLVMFVSGLVLAPSSVGMTRSKKPPVAPSVSTTTTTDDGSSSDDPGTIQWDPDDQGDQGDQVIPPPPGLVLPVPTQPGNSTQPSPPVTTTTNPVTMPTVTVPQVVTTATTTTSSVATTTTPVVPPPPAVPKAPPPPYCLNHPDYMPPLPSRWYRTSDGNCFYRGEDNYGLCKGDQYNLVAYSDVNSWLKDGYGMGIIVDTPDPNYRLNCLVTDVTTYRMNPNDFVFSGKYVQDGWPRDSREYDTPQPYPWSDWKPLYPLWVRRATASQFVAGQSYLSIRAYGLLWYDGSRYQTANAFSKYLNKNHLRWKVWKKQNPDLAAVLVMHQQLLVRK